MIKLTEVLSEPQTATPFKGIVYRGDDKKFDKFDYSFIGRSTGAHTVGFWFTDSPEAAEFFGQHVRAFEITMDNPKVVTGQEFAKGYPHGPPKFAADAMQEGHDGVIITDIRDGDRWSTVFCVFDRDQIKPVAAS